MSFGNRLDILSVKAIMAHLLQINFLEIEMYRNLCMSLTFQAEKVEKMFNLGG